MIFCPALAIMVIFIIVSIGSIAYGLSSVDEPYVPLGMILFLVTVFFGFGLYGNIADYGTGYREYDVELINTPTSVITVDKTNHIPIVTFTDVPTYKLLSTKTNCVLRLHGYTNMYKQFITNGWSVAP